MRDAAIEAEKEFVFILADDLFIELENTDLLFIDSLGTYGHLTRELNLHSNKAQKYIIFHDTVQYATVGMDGGEGIMRAIQEFLTDHIEWKIKEVYTNNNGLIILDRCTL
jgi:hypothetical protein